MYYLLVWVQCSEKCVIFHAPNLAGYIPSVLDGLGGGVGWPTFLNTYFTVSIVEII